MLNNVLLSRRINESISGMENAQIIHKLHISFLEIQRQAESLSEEMKSIQCLSLSFGDGRNVFASGKVEKPGESSSSVLNYHSFGRGFCRGGVIE